MKKKLPFSFGEVAPLLFAIFVDILGFGMVYPVLTALFTNGGSLLFSSPVSEELRLFYLSISFLLYPLFMFFGASFMGDLSDIFGRKRVLLICMLGLFCGFLMLGLGITLSSLWLIFLARAFSGFMSASMPIAMASIADLSTKENKTQHMSFVTLANALGFVLGPLFGGILSDSALSPLFGFYIPFYFSALLALVAFIWLSVTYQDSYSPKGNQIDWKRFYMIFVQVAGEKSIRLLALSFLLMQIGVGLFLQLILLYFEENYHYSSSVMGLFNGYTGFWMAFSLVGIIPYVAKKWGAEVIAHHSLYLSGLFTLLVSLFSSEIALWLVFIPLMISTQIAFATMLTSFSNSANQESQGFVMGISGSVVALSFAISGMAPSLIPFLGIKPLIFIGSVLILASAALMGIYRNRL